VEQFAELPAKSENGEKEMRIPGIQLADFGD
jgi:hypothetical protein